MTMTVVGVKEENAEGVRRGIKVETTQWPGILSFFLALGPNLGGSGLYVNLEAVLLHALYWQKEVFENWFVK